MALNSTRLGDDMLARVLTATGSVEADLPDDARDVFRAIAAAIVAEVISYADVSGSAELADPDMDGFGDVTGGVS